MNVITYAPPLSRHAAFEQRRKHLVLGERIACDPELLEVPPELREAPEELGEPTAASEQ